MPLNIIPKPKTQPTSVDKHPAFIPLRVINLSTYDQEKTAEQVSVGDIVISFPSKWNNVAETLNVTKQIMIDRTYQSKFFVVRAYDIAQIIVTNDNEPAPV